MKIRLYHAFMVLFAFVAISCSKESIQIADKPVAENNVDIESELLRVVNNYRETKGATALEFSAVAYTYANEHTDYMISKGNLSHDNFSARASSISSQENAQYVAENVAKDYETAIEAFENWLESSDHRKTIEGEFTHTAVSVKKDLQGKLYYTQLFFR
ncbi:CAP domain-containing protein [uncultured Kriegella sp.]|uniref:CAP domain-containing protein n=1 Tax=uncultured Kriegella sp. TaxID=1798910 RepID=UPI0030D9AA3A